MLVVNYFVVLQVRLEIVIYPDIQQNSISCLYQQLVKAPREDKGLFFFKIIFIFGLPEWIEHIFIPQHCTVICRDYQYSIRQIKQFLHWQSPARHFSKADYIAWKCIAVKRINIYAVDSWHQWALGMFSLTHRIVDNPLLTENKILLQWCIG